MHRLDKTPLLLAHGSLKADMLTWAMIGVKGTDTDPEARLWKKNLAPVNLQEAKGGTPELQKKTTICFGCWLN